MAWSIRSGYGFRHTPDFPDRRVPRMAARRLRTRERFAHRFEATGPWGAGSAGIGLAGATVCGVSLTRDAVPDGPPKIGPERTVHKAMRAIQRNSIAMTPSSLRTARAVRGESQVQLSRRPVELASDRRKTR